MPWTRFHMYPLFLFCSVVVWFNLPILRNRCLNYHSCCEYFTIFVFCVLFGCCNISFFIHWITMRKVCRINDDFHWKWQLADKRCSTACYWFSHSDLCRSVKEKYRISYFHFGAVSLPLFWFNLRWILLLLGIKWSYFAYFIPGLTHVAFLFHFFTFRKFIDYMSLSELTNGFILIRPLIAKIKSNSIIFSVCDIVFVIVQRPNWMNFSDEMSVNFEAFIMKVDRSIYSWPNGYMY